MTAKPGPPQKVRLTEGLGRAHSTTSTREKLIEHILTWFTTTLGFEAIEVKRATN